MLDIEFSGKIWYWRGPSPFFFVTVPAEPSDHLHNISSVVTYGWGMIPVTARIGETVFKTALWPKDGGYIVPLKEAVRRAEGLQEGEEVTIRLEVKA